MVGLPLVCLLIALPFLSAIVIVLVAPLRGLVAQHPHVTFPLGAGGLLLLLAGLVGVLPEPVAIPLMLVGGVVSGFSMFWPRAGESDDEGEDWWRRHFWPEEPPPGPLDYGPDWWLFDVLRDEWERKAASRAS